MPESPAALADRIAILDLYARYAAGMDAGDRELFASVWTDDGVFTCPEIGLDCQGREAILAYWDRGPGAAPIAPAEGSALRIASNHLIDLDGDVATGRAEFVALRRTDDAFAVYSAGVYLDEFARTPDGWKIRRRVMDIAPMAARR